MTSNTRSMSHKSRCTTAVATFLLILGISASPTQAHPYQVLADNTPTLPPEYHGNSGQLAMLAGFTIESHQYNICSSLCAATIEDTIDTALYLFEVSEAWTLSLNEACHNNAVDLRDRSGRITGFSFVITKRNVRACGSDGRFGNAILTIGSGISYTTHRYVDQSPSPCSLASGHECRAMVCRKFNVLGIVTAACSSHLARPNTNDQGVAYESKASAYSGNMFYSLAGDHNQEPSNIPSIFAAAYTDGSSGATWDPTAWGGESKKFDYMHFVDGWASSIIPQPPVCLTGRSDHCYVVGNAIFTF